MKIYLFSARPIYLPNGKTSILFSAWPAVLSSMKLPLSCWVNSRPHTA